MHCPWDAEAGYYYYVNVEGRDSKGNRVVRQERRVRWEPASGVVDHVFDDELVPGTPGVPLDLLRQVEPFPTQEIVPYDTAFLSGHVVEHYQVALTEAAEHSEEQMRAALEQLCAQQVPGDTHRNLRIHPDVLGPHVQARARADLAARLHVRRAAVSGRRQRLHRQDRRPVSEQRLEDPAADPARDRRAHGDLTGQLTMAITLKDETRRDLLASIKRYVAENLDQDIGDLKAGLLLDYVLEELHPSVYNQAIQDAQRYFQERRQRPRGRLLRTGVRLLEGRAHQEALSDS